MSDINKVMLIGHLGKAPQIRHLENEVSVTSFPLATSEVISKGGQRSENTEWHNIVMWCSLAELAVKFCKKGSWSILKESCPPESTRIKKE